MLLDIGGRRIVVDCGLGVSRALVEAGMRLGELDLILVTHLHSDHVLELGPLIHTAWTTGLSHPVTVCGPAGTRALWQSFLASLSYDIATRIADEGRPDLADLVTIREYGPGPVLDEAGLTVTALRVDHPPVADCFALKVEGEGRSIVFSSDTTFFPPLADFARGADILVQVLADEGVDPGSPELRGDLADVSQSCTDQLQGRELDYGANGAAEDLGALRAQWRVPGLAILGIGSGARTALAYATAHPDAVSLLALDSPAPSAGDQEAAARSALSVPRSTTSCPCSRSVRASVSFSGNPA